MKGKNERGEKKRKEGVSMKGKNERGEKKGKEGILIIIN